jgi:hypothetical protein
MFRSCSPKKQLDCLTSEWYTDVSMRCKIGIISFRMISAISKFWRTNGIDMHANPCQNFSSVIYCSVFETQSQSSSWIDHRITFPDMYIVIWDCLSNKPMMTVIRGWCDQSWPYTPTSQMANSYQTANLEFQNCSCESVESWIWTEAFSSITE